MNKRTRKCHGQRPEVIKPKEEDSTTVFKYGKRLLQNGRERSVPFVLGKWLKLGAKKIQVKLSKEEDS